jgi:hypothetical protein
MNENRKQATKLLDYILGQPGLSSNIHVDDRIAIEQARERGEDYLGVALRLGYKLREAGVGIDGQMRYSYGKSIAQGEG